MTHTCEKRVETPEAAGEYRQWLREQGWRSDFTWIKVGAGSAPAVVEGASGEDVRRTIAYLPSLRELDGGAPKVWKDGDVPVPNEADAREVMVATPGLPEWESELLEAPAETIALVDDPCLDEDDSLFEVPDWDQPFEARDEAA